MHSTFRFTLLAALLLVVLVLAACSPAPNTEDVSPIGTPPPAMPENTPSPVARGDGEGDVVESARADLADRLGISPESIQVVSVEQVDWRDSSLGCPKPGMNYLQVITPGYLIRLEANGEVYEYHTSQSNIVYCENPATSVEGNVVNQLIAAARADLASVTGMAQGKIEVIETEYVEWRDSSLGCPKAGQSYLQVITPGYLIRLQAGDKEYEYHTSMTNVVLCEK